MPTRFSASPASTRWKSPSSALSIWGLRTWPAPAEGRLRQYRGRDGSDPRVLAAEAAPAAAAPRSYVPLLRETTRMFQPPLFAELLAPYHESAGLANHGRKFRLRSRHCLGLAAEGGKRLRPFVTMAAYAVARHGMAVLDCGRQIDARIPLPICGWPWRSRPCTRLRWSTTTSKTTTIPLRPPDRSPPPRRGAGGQHGRLPDWSGLSADRRRNELAGRGCMRDILNQLSHAHLELCRGQGAELHWENRPAESLRPADVMKVYALKTAPAFEVALYAGSVPPVERWTWTFSAAMRPSRRRLSNQQRLGRLARRRSQQAEPRSGRFGRPADHAAGVRQRPNAAGSRWLR